MAAHVRAAQVAAVLVLILFAAEPQALSAPSKTSAVSARRPSLTILAPKPGSTIHDSTITVAVSVKNFRVVNKQFQPPVAGAGHVHFYLDVKTLPTTHVYPSPVHYHSISGTSYTWTGVRPGRHIVGVQLVGNDHVPLRPQVEAEVTITVRS